MSARDFRQGSAQSKALSALDMLPMASVRSTLMFVAIVLTGCGLFAAFADAFAPPANGAVPGGDPQYLGEAAGGEAIPVIPYEGGDNAEVVGWDEDASLSDGPAFDEPGDDAGYDPFGMYDESATGAPPAWSEEPAPVSQSVNRGGTAHPARIE